MPVPFSIDLRWRVVWLDIAHGYSTSHIARVMCISESTVRRILNLFTQTGDITPRTRRYGPHPLFGQHEQVVLLRLVLDNVGIYLNELQLKLQEIFGVIVSPSTICRTLKKIGCSRRVIQHITIITP